MKIRNVVTRLLQTSNLICACQALGALAAEPCGFDQWSPVSSPSSQWLRAADFGNGRFVAAGDTGSRISSSDGLTWTSHPGNPSEAYQGATFANGLFYLVGARFSNDGLSRTGIILTSLDGAAWTERFAATNFSFLDVAFGNGTYVTIAGSSVVGGTSSIASAFISDNGLDWSPAQIGTGFWPFSIAFGGGQFVTVGGSLIMRSADGLNWTASTNLAGGGLGAVAYGNGRFIAVGLGGLILTSTDGSAWVQQPSGTSEDLWAVTAGPSAFVAAGNNASILLSQNNGPWSIASSGGAQFRGAAFGAGRFVAVGRYGSIQRSGESCGGTGPRLTLQRTNPRMLQLEGTVGRDYRIEFAPTPHHPVPWPVLTEISSLPASPFPIEDTTPNATAQFYRAVLLP
ncbi:MAG: hypothetical protein L0219_09660 [Phycisphaerales bacterium]|nr:hypothetical protein [Phycisphaerales bacterium]